MTFWRRGLQISVSRIFIGASLIFIAGCGTQESVRIESEETEAEVSPDFQDLPWRTFSGSSLRESSRSGHWVLVDTNELGIFPIRSGNEDYRRSRHVLELLTSMGVECFRYAGDPWDDSEEGFGYTLVELTHNMEVPDDGRVGYFFNFDKGECIPIRDGTAGEITRILELIALDRREQNE